MKLHLPKKLLHALFVSFLSLGTTVFAQSDDIISINFGTSNLPTNVSGEVGGIGVGGWMNITGANANAVNGTHQLTNQSNVASGTLTLNTPQNPWGPSNANNDNLAHAIQSSYLDLGANNQYSISISSDYQFSSVVLYMSGDGGKYAPVNINGTSYIGGTDTTGTNAWGDRNYNTTFSDSNTITVTGINGSIEISNTTKSDSSIRATLAGLQIINSTSDFTYSATLATGTTIAADQTWAKGGNNTSLADIAVSDRLMYIKAADTGSTLDVADNGFQSINVSSGKLSLISSSNTPIIIDTLWAQTESQIIIESILDSSNILNTGGNGTIIFNKDQSLSGLSGAGNIQLASNATLTLNGATASTFKGAISVDSLSQIVKNDNWNMTGSIFINQSGNYNQNDLANGSFSHFRQASGIYLAGENTITWSEGALQNSNIFAGEGGKITYIKTGNTSASLANLSNIQYININEGTLNIDGKMANIVEMHIADGARLQAGYGGSVNNASTKIFMEGGATIASGSGNGSDHQDFNASFIINGNNGKAVNFLGSNFGNAFSYKGTITGNGTVRFGQAIGTNAYTVSATISDGSSTEKIALLLELSPGQGLTISGNNTYTGGTTINSGNITANSNTAFGSGVIALNGGTLNMNNKIISNDLIYSGGTLNNYGNYTGTLSALDNCTLSSGFKGGIDLVNVSTITMNGTLGTSGTSLFTLSSLTGGDGTLFFNLDGIEEGMNYTILTVGDATTTVDWNSIKWDSNFKGTSHVWTTNGNSLTLNAVPEPSSAILGLLGLGSLMLRRRRA